MNSLGEFLDGAARQFGSRPALRCRPRYRTEVWSYDELRRHSNQVACWLRRQGVRKGDRLLLWAPNSPWWVATYFGCLRLGAIVVPLDVRSSDEFVRRVVAQTEPSCAFVSALTGSGLTGSIAATPIEALASLVTADDGAGDPGIMADDIAEVIFTSGTTGAPKGVVLTHGNILANVEAINRVLPSEPDFRLLSLLPLSHMFEQTVGLLLPLRGGASVYYPATRQPTALFGDLAEQRITTVLLVPQALQMFMAGIEGEFRQQGHEVAWKRLQRLAEHLPMPARRLVFLPVHRRLGGRLQLFISGGATLPPDLIHRWEILGIRVLQGYGATEASPVITGTSLGDRAPRSVGRAVPGVEVAIAADGEVLARGPSVTAGYWRDPSATEAAFQEGWYRTGDLGSLDRRGYLYLHGRTRDLIVLADGQNVYPEDVEQVLRQATGVRDAVVIGRPGARGPQVHAILLLDAPAIDPGGAVREANGRLAPHQRIGGFTVWPEADFPRTLTLKVKRQEMVRALERPSGEAGAPVTPTGDSADGTPFLRLLARLTGHPLRQVVASARLGEDLGVDSLGRVELLAAIDAELGTYVDESRLGPDSTVAELEDLVKAAQPDVRPQFPRWPLSPLAGAARRLAQLAVFAALRRVAPASSSGATSLDGLSSPVIFVANHTSHLDSPTLLQALPRRWRRRVAVAAAADYFFTSRLRGASVALLLNAFPFSRTEAVRPTLQHCARLVDHGWSLLLYPEGTRSTGGRMAPFKDGVGLLAVEMAVPVVPVWLEGVGQVLPKGRRLPRPAPVTVRFGPPLRFCAGTSYPVATKAIEEAVRSLAPSESTTRFTMGGR